MAEKPATARLSELIEEHERPWRDRETMELVLEELDRDQGTAAQLLGCSSATISTWNQKLEIGQERVREEQGGGKICVRCEEHETVKGARNDMCNECLTYVRVKDSGFDSKVSFSDAVKNAEGWTA